MSKRQNYTKSFLSSSNLNRGLRVMEQDIKFDRERVKLTHQSPIKKLIKKTNRDLQKIDQEIASISKELSDSDEEYLNETIPKTPKERSRYFQNIEPAEAEVVRSSIKEALDIPKRSKENYNENSNRSQLNLNINTSVSGSDFPKSTSNLSLSDLESQIHLNPKDEERRTKMLRLSYTTNALSATQVRSQIPNQTEMSLQDLQSKSMKRAKRHTRTIDDFNSKSTLSDTVRKPYQPPSPGKIKQIDDIFLLSYDPILKITYKQCATNLCEDCDDLIAKLSQ